MRIRYAVTFEFPERPPATHRGLVEASSEATCVARGIREAKKVLLPRNWSSMVCLIVERLS